MLACQTSRGLPQTSLVASPRMRASRARYGRPVGGPASCEEHRPHLALVDLMLADTVGIELMQGIMFIANVPVIFLPVGQWAMPN